MSYPVYNFCCSSMFTVHLVIRWAENSINLRVSATCLFVVNVPVFMVQTVGICLLFRVAAIVLDTPESNKTFNLSSLRILIFIDGVR